MRPLHPPTMTIPVAIAVKTPINCGKVMAMLENRVRRPLLRL
jgi:hypothetical protein